MSASPNTAKSTSNIAPGSLRILHPRSRISWRVLPDRWSITNAAWAAGSSSGPQLHPHVLNPFLDCEFCRGAGRSLNRSMQVLGRRQIDRLVSGLLLAQLFFEVLRFHGSIPCPQSLLLQLPLQLGEIAPSDPSP